MNDEGEHKINILSAGDRPVKLGDKWTSGEREMRQFMQDTAKLQDLTLDSNFSADNMVMLAKSWSETFYRYGYSKKDAIKQFLYFEGEDAIKSKWQSMVDEAEIKLGKDIPLTHKQILLREVLKDRRYYKPPGFPEKPNTCLLYTSPSPRD